MATAFLLFSTPKRWPTGKSLCKGPFFLFVPLLLAGAMACLARWALRPVFGVLRWHWFAVLYVACFLLSLFIVDAVGYLIELRHVRHA